MQNRQSNTAYSLYALYKTLSNEIRQQFLQELLQKQTGKLESLDFINCSGLIPPDSQLRENIAT